MKANGAIFFAVVLLLLSLDFFRSILFPTKELVTININGKIIVKLVCNIALSCLCVMRPYFGADCARKNTYRPIAN